MSRLKAFWKCTGVKQNLKFCQSETVCFAFLHLLCNHSSVVTSGTLNNVVYHVVASFSRVDITIPDCKDTFPCDQCILNTFLLFYAQHFTYSSFVTFSSRTLAYNQIEQLPINLFRKIRVTESV